MLCFDLAIRVLIFVWEEYWVEDKDVCVAWIYLLYKGKFLKSCVYFNSNIERVAKPWLNLIWNGENLRVELLARKESLVTNN